MSVKSRITTGAGIAAVLAVTGLAGAGLQAIAPAPASAATVQPSATQEAYHAFAEWEHHPCEANLDRLVVDSFRLPKGTQADIDQLAADANGAGTFPVADDEQYVFQDLTNGYGL